MHRPPNQRLEVTETPGRIVIAVHGALDDDIAHDLYDSVLSRAEHREPCTLEIDLRGMEGWTSAGLRRLGECAGFCVRFRMGPHVAGVQR